MRAVERAGGLALLLPATPDAVSAGMAQWLALCGGFVLPGGGDVAPTYYGQSPVPVSYTHLSGRRPPYHGWTLVFMIYFRHAAANRNRIYGRVLSA